MRLELRPSIKQQLEDIKRWLKAQNKTFNFKQPIVFDKKRFKFENNRNT